MHLPQAGLLLAQDFVQQGARISGEGCRQLQGAVMINDGLLDLFSRKVGEIAQPFLPPPAEEVAVAGAVAPFRFRIDQTSCSIGSLTPEAEQTTFQVVLQHPIPLARAASHIHDVLHPVEKLLRHDRLVPARVQLTLVVDPAGVVGILEHLVQPLEGQRASTRSLLPHRRVPAGTVRAVRRCLRVRLL